MTRIPAWPLTALPDAALPIASDVIPARLAAEPRLAGGWLMCSEEVPVRAEHRDMASDNTVHALPGGVSILPVA